MFSLRHISINGALLEIVIFMISCYTDFLLVNSRAAIFLRQNDVIKHDMYIDAMCN